MTTDGAGRCPRVTGASRIEPNKNRDNRALSRPNYENRERNDYFERLSVNGSFIWTSLSEQARESELVGPITSYRRPSPPRAIFHYGHFHLSRLVWKYGAYPFIPSGLSPDAVHERSTP
jgi:hypothetical protein